MIIKFKNIYLNLIINKKKPRKKIINFGLKLKISLYLKKKFKKKLIIIEKKILDKKDKI